MELNIVLVGAGSAAFGPPTFTDLYLSEGLHGSNIILHDVDKPKLNMVYEVISKENERTGGIFTIKKTLNREEALEDADFVICSIEHGDRFKLRWQDNTIPRKYGTTEMMGENGGPGGFFHSARQIPEVLKIVADVDRICPNAYFINYSNPLSRICLAIKRVYPDIKMFGLCHQIELLTNEHLPKMLNRELEELRLIVGGLNHFAFLFGLENFKTGENLMPDFNHRCLEYFEDGWDRFHYSELTFEVYKRFGFFPYVGDNHLCEYVQFGSEFTKIEDIKAWIKRMEQANLGTNARLQRYYKRLEKGRYPRKGMLRPEPSGERAIPIIEAIIKDKHSYEYAVNIPNDGIIENLPNNLIIECSAKVDKNGLHGVKIGKIPKDLGVLLKREAATQDLCIEAILEESKMMAINCLALDVNCGSYEIAEKVFDEMMDLQKKYLPNFK
jgi:alpha-galactosidase